MANSAKTVSAEQVPVKARSSQSARKVVPLEKRLTKLRKEEAKRRRQLDAVQAQSERARSQLTEIIAAVNAWVQNPEGVAATPERTKGR
jgi:septal ring factor EnvC (AmiA/AmiB activator)